MKKFIIISAVVAGALFLTMMVLNPGMAGSSEKGTVKSSPIPEKVMKIAEKSCVNCHVQPGNMMALSHLDLSNWEKYSQEKQAAKAKAMCNMVSKGKMPPKSYRKNHPDGIPSNEEIKTICDWAASLQIKGK